MCFQCLSFQLFWFTQVKLEEEKKKKEDEGKDVKGIPEFWLTTFKNVEMLQEMIMEHDEPILEKLTDVTVTFSEKPMVRNFFYHSDSLLVQVM
jgi:nucleosome assembly protein 1-like 1